MYLIFSFNFATQFFLGGVLHKHGVTLHPKTPCDKLSWQSCVNMVDRRAALLLWCRGRCLWMWSEGWWSRLVCSPPPQAGPEKLAGPTSPLRTRCPRHLAEDRKHSCETANQQKTGMMGWIQKRITAHPSPGPPGRWPWWCGSQFPPRCRGTRSRQSPGPLWTDAQDSPDGPHQRPEEPHSHF